MLLKDYERKRERAMLHFDVLREAIDGSLDVHHQPVRGEFDRDASKYIFRMPLEPTGRDWAPVVGDFVYNTRASLDYLITALVRSTGEKENTENQFPIYGIPKGKGFQDVDEWWETSPAVARKLKNTPAGTKAALKQLQPFRGVPVTNPLDHPLFALAQMSNRDKHRRLNLLARVAEFHFIDRGGQPIFQGPLVAPQGRITEANDRDAYTVTLAVEADKAHMDIYLLPAYDLSLHEPPELIGDLIETLRDINQFIDNRVLPTVKALL
jgi:hypothetical protein